MAENIMKSPGVSAREIDLSGPGTTAPQGIPAGVIGTAVKGPAFVPVTFATYKDFKNIFGGADARLFGPMAVNEWMKNARSGTFLRVLGIGDGKKRSSTTGKVTNSGFVVGDQLVQEGTGNLAANGYATEAAAGAYAKTVDLFQTSAEANNDRVDIYVPTAAGGSGVTYTLIARNGGTLGTSGDHADTVVYYNASGSPANRNANLILAINGTTDETKAVFGDADLKTGGIAGITASAGSDGNNVTVTADTRTVHGRDITFTMKVGGGGSSIMNEANDATVYLKGVLGVKRGSALGRTYFLNCLMSQSAGSTYFADAGISNEVTASILRGVLMVASGVRPALSGWGGANVSASLRAYDEFHKTYGGASADSGESLGAIDLSTGGNQTFKMFLNGFTNTNTYSSCLTASLNPQSPSYFAKVFNTDPALLEEQGHYLYSHYDVPSTLAVPLPASAAAAASSDEHIIALVSGSGTRATEGGASTYVPDFESFEDRFQHSRSPWIISQTIGSGFKNLFRFHSLDAGEIGNRTWKVSIQNVQASSDATYKYGQFDVLIRSWGDQDLDQIVLEKYVSVNLDPSSDRYIGRVIGDQNKFFDFEKMVDNQKLVVEGLYPNRSNYVRVEVTDAVETGVEEDTALPFGFRGHGHLVTSGQGEMLEKPNYTSTTLYDGRVPLAAHNTLLGAPVEPPIPLRRTVKVGSGSQAAVNSRLFWGVQWEDVKYGNNDNKGTAVSDLIKSFRNYYPSFGVSYPAFVRDNTGTANTTAGSVLDVDEFNKNLFSLERVLVKCKDGDTAKEVDPREWKNAEYRRTGIAYASSAEKGSGNGYRFLNVSKDFTQQASKRYMKFTCFPQGGYDGLNIFDPERSALSTIAAAREIYWSTNQGGPAGPTVASFRKGIDIMATKADVDIQVLAIPGIRESGITDYALDATEERFDAIYLMDIEECNHEGTSFSNLVSGSTGTLNKINVQNTVNRFLDRNMDSSFAAAYFPDCVVLDDDTGSLVKCPPSVAVLGALSLNDKLAHPWFAPAGFTRGALASTTENWCKLNRANLDELYEADINPITSFPTSQGVVVFGQKTLLQAQSSLDRVNVRRLLIDIRRKVKNVANRILFEPNRQETLAKFSSQVQPILSTIQAQQGLDRFKVVIDTTTTTQQDVENNTIRGKIFLQPTRAVEFISLDFVVTNAGAEI